MSIIQPFSLQAWIEEHRHLLKPPVGNAKVYEDTDFIVMIVGGPNSRKDYHYNEGEEFFYQVEGDVTIKIIDDDGVPKDMNIKQGDIFLLPPRTPHSPQRPANTIGLVIERKRQAIELDAFMWFCEHCGTKLYEEFLPLTDIVSELPPIFDRFWNDLDHRTCKKCGTVIDPPIKS